MLAQVGQAAPLPHQPGEQFTVATEHRRDLAEGRQGAGRPAGERVGEITEQPGPAEAAAADLDPGDPGLPDHLQGVGSLPDVPVAEHRDRDVPDELGHRVPVGVGGVGLGDRTPVQADRGDPGVLGDPTGVQEVPVVVVDADPGLHRHRDTVAVGGPHGRPEDLAEQITLPGQHPAAALPGDLGHRAAEVEVDMVHPELGTEDLRRGSHHRRVDAVELHRPDLLGGRERQHLQRLAVALDQAAGGDHLADVQAGALLGAQLPEGGIGHPGHRCEHDRGVDDHRVRPGRSRKGQRGGHAERGGRSGQEHRAIVRGVPTPPTVAT
ncbi:hypothetical protein SDC9_61950 [bioreactor metagenome]|uniref:Uncharacterized protein n=1 Tax=bioreactor metagenome TaxID=1076179 RepID=A0A644XHL1_9ZZZZ